MLPLLLTYLNIRTRWDINQLCHPMHLPSGILKKLVIPSYLKITLFLGRAIQLCPVLLLQAPANRLPQQAWRLLAVWLRNYLKLRSLLKTLCKETLWLNLSVIHILDNSAKDFNTLADKYWPESLGQQDLDIPSSKYHSEDLIVSDSLSGLNRLIASSLDAFQNCFFFFLG